MLRAIESYLKENIDDQTTIEAYRDLKTIPLFLKKQYAFYAMDILGYPCILLDIQKAAPGIEEMNKHIQLIQRLTNRKIVLFDRNMTNYRRKSLIQKRIPFLIENGQMFLPFISLDIDKAASYLDPTVETFSTTTQIAYLFFLYNEGVVLNTTEFAEKMNCSLMTASRVLNKLVDAKLLHFTIGGITGRSKRYKRISDPKYFSIGCTYLRSPVRRVIYTKNEPKNVLISGFDALAFLSMISSPKNPIRAVPVDRVHEIEEIRNMDYVKDHKCVALEVWNYDPKQFSDQKYVDLCSLYLSLRDHKDERVEQALAEVLKGQKWYTD